MSKRQRSFPAKVRKWIAQGHPLRIAQDKYRASRILKTDRCERCGGTGNEHYYSYRRCRDCGGSGRTREKP